MARRHVTVSVGAKRRIERRKRPRLVLVGVAPPGTPLLDSVYPDFRIKVTRHPEGGECVEHFRLPSGADLSRLPNLRSPLQSRMMDAARMVIDAGMPTVDILLARSRGVSPWEVWRPEAFSILEPFLVDMGGAVVVFPDAVGPPQIGFRAYSPQARLANLVGTVRAWSDCMAENFQIGLVDLPRAGVEDTMGALEIIRGSDFGLVTWEGSIHSMTRHGWRSGASHVGAMLALNRVPSQTLLGKRTPILAGRDVRTARWGQLGVPQLPVMLPEEIGKHCIRLKLNTSGSAAELISTETLRQPLGNWRLALLRTAKLIHQRLVIAANMFVFREANQGQAFALQAAIDKALEPYIQRDIIGGPDGADDPEVVTFANPDPAQPALVAQVGIYLRPWVRNMRVNLAVRPGEQPQSEVL